MLEEGKKLPAFKTPDENGEIRRFKDLVGKKGLIIYTYPKDNTPGCTLEAQAFRDHLADFSALGFNVVGLSKDSTRSHCSFIEKHGLTFPLLSDPEHELLETLGAWGEKKNYGKVSMGTIRSTFVIDGAGKILKIYRNVKAKGHVERVLADLRESVG